MNIQIKFLRDCEYEPRLSGAAKVKKPKIYYAHSLSIYDKPQEARDVATLEALGFEVLNPNCEECKKKCDELLSKDERNIASAKIMEYFFYEVIPSCQALAFRAFHDGKIGAGVWGEVKHAQLIGLPIIELPNILYSRSMSVDETREVLKLVGLR